MSTLFEIELVNGESGSRRILRVRAISAEIAWSKVDVGDNEIASIRIVENKDASQQELSQRSVAEVEDEQGRQRNSRVIQPSIIGYLSELFVWSFTSKAVSESSLARSGVRPSLIMPVSLLARRGLVVFYILVLVASYFVNARIEESYTLFGSQRTSVEWDHLSGSIGAAISLVSWMIIVAVIRYAACVFPWERKNRDS